MEGRATEPKRNPKIGVSVQQQYLQIINFFKNINILKKMDLVLIFFKTLPNFRPVFWPVELGKKGVFGVKNGKRYFKRFRPSILA